MRTCRPLRPATRPHARSAAALARVPTAAEDVAVLRSEFALEKRAAERVLQEAGGNLEVALRTLVGADSLAGVAWGAEGVAAASKAAVRKEV